jgi:iron-sulfur cluster repair protein YtfE (RIC family)
MIDRSQLIKDYGEIIDNQIEEILRLKGVRDKMLQEFYEIEQILGKALGYPWLKDDQKNFPLATEKDGVCIGPNTACSLAMEAADKIKQLKKRHPTKEEALAQYEFIKQRSQRKKLEN